VKNFPLEKHFSRILKNL